jgi:hypothetical protein
MDYFLPAGELALIDRWSSFKGLYTLFILLSERNLPKGKGLRTEWTASDWKLACSFFYAIQ